MDEINFGDEISDEESALLRYLPTQYIDGEVEPNDDDEILLTQSPQVKYSPFIAGTEEEITEEGIVGDGANITANTRIAYYPLTFSVQNDLNNYGILVQFQLGIYCQKIIPDPTGHYPQATYDIGRAINIILNLTLPININEEKTFHIPAISAFNNATLGHFATLHWSEHTTLIMPTFDYTVKLLDYTKAFNDIPRSDNLIESLTPMTATANYISIPTNIWKSSPNVNNLKNYGLYVYPIITNNYLGDAAIKWEDSYISNTGAILETYHDGRTIDILVPVMVDIRFFTTLFKDTKGIKFAKSIISMQQNFSGTHGATFT